MSSCNKMYYNYGSYLRSRGFDKQVCDYLARITALEEEIVNKFDISGGKIEGDVSINGDLDIMCNGIIDISFLKFCNGTILNQEDISGLDISSKYDKTGGLISGDVSINGVLDMSCNNINNIEQLNFCSLSTVGDYPSEFRVSSTNNLLINSLADITMNTNKIVLKTGGNIGINNSTPSTDLDIIGDVSINGILDMECNLIQDVSGIYFCDGTYIGPGSSFDISTNEVLKINESMLVVDTSGNIGINVSNPTNKLDISGGNLNITNGVYSIDNSGQRKSCSIETDTGVIYFGSSNNTRFGEASFNLIFSSDPSVDTNGLALGTFNAREDLILGVNNEAVIRLDASNQIIKMFRDIDMCCNLIQDVCGIYFCDGTYIGTGNSFDISTNQDIKINEKITFNASGNIVFNSDLGQGTITANDMSSSVINVPLLSYKIDGLSNPFCISRQSIYFNGVSYNVASGPSTTTFQLGTPQVNNMRLTLSGDDIVASNEISGQYVELYVNVTIDAGTSAIEFSLDISGIDVGNTFYEVIDNRSVSKNNVFNLSFGPIIVSPLEFSTGNQYRFLITNDGGDFILLKSKLVIKSYFM